MLIAVVLFHVLFHSTFMKYSNVTDPRALAILFEKTEAELQRTQHPDPYRRQFISHLTPLFFGRSLIECWEFSS